MPPESAVAAPPPRLPARARGGRRGRPRKGVLYLHQRVALKRMDSHFMTLWAGRGGAGKTMGAITGLLRQSIMNPGELYLIAGRTRGAVVNNVWPDFKKVLSGLDYSYDYNATLGIVTLFNGARFEFVGAHTKEAIEKIQGRNAAGAMLDEFALLTQSYVEMAITRVRRGRHPCIIATFNKTMPAHWVKQKYWDLADERGYARIETYTHVPVIDMTGAERSLTGAARARLIDNEWAGNSGLCFPNYHIRNPELEPLNREDIQSLEIAVDFGMSNPTAALYIANGDTVIGEYYSDPEKEMLRVSQHADAILAIADDLAECDVWQVFIDPSAVALREELRGKVSVVNADNSVKTGIQTTQRWLESGRLRLALGAAPELEREMATYAWDEGAQARGEDKPVKSNDHACDALRYYCASREARGGMLGKPTIAHELQGELSGMRINW